MPKFPEIPGYKFVKELGKGGMADVYLALQDNLNRMVAIKVLIPEVFRDPLFLKRFLREAQTLSKLIHPNIITVYDVGQTGDTYYIVMEYLQESLKERIKTYRKGSPNEVLLLIKQVAGALYYAHQIGFIHRDIKPDNIMFRKDGTPVVVDFGIARAVHSSTKLTRTGMSVGTPSYISPEQAKGEKVDGRSDIYSLGVVFYELLTGKVPYKAENTLGVILKHIEEPVPRLPANLYKYQGLLNKMMDKNKKKRIRSEAELDKIIKSLLDFRFPQVTKKEKTKKAKIRDDYALTKEFARQETGSGVVSGSKGDFKAGSRSISTGKKKKPAMKFKVTSREYKRKNRKWLLGFLLLLFCICGGVILYVVKLKSDYRVLDTEVVKSMIKKNNYFDRIWNKYGKFNNHFNKKVIKRNIVVEDKTTSLMWHYSGSRIPLKYEEIKKWLLNLNRSRYAGYSDWRLPTLKEAASLLSSPDKEGDLFINKIFSRIQKSIWTGDKYSNTSAWAVRFDEGYLISYPFDFKNHIRPVRSMQ